MKTIIKNVIASRNYEISDLLKKLDKLWLEGGISDAERDELAAEARNNVNMEKGYAGYEARLRAVEERLDAMERVNAPEEDTAGEYPAWKQPTGAHDAYFTDSKMTYTDGRKYTCVAPEGLGVTYGPDVLPQMWRMEE